MEVTSGLAAFAHGLSYNRIPADVRARCHLFVLDALGLMVGTADFFRKNKIHRLETYVRDLKLPGTATVVGTGLRSAPTVAAFANGTLSEALDFQDSNMDVLTHNGSPIIPAVLATAEQTDAGWGAVTAAIVAGYEVHSRLLATVQTGHWYRGFQGLGTFGTSGATVAAGKLMGLTRAQMESALGISGCIMPVSNSDQVFKAHSMKACIPGQAASTGITAACLARSGFHGGPLEGEPPQYHAPLHILSDGPVLEKALAGINEVWHCRRVAFKPYPAGHLIIGPVELVLDLLAEQPIAPDEIEAIDIVTYKHAIFRTGKYVTDQTNYVDAHFSIPFCVAVALIDGALTPRQLMPDRLRDRKVHELHRRVRLTEDPEMSRAYPELWPAKLTIRFKNGASRTRRVDRVKWSPERPPSWDELAAKFHMLVDPVLGPAKTARAIDMIGGLRRGDSLKPILKLLAGTKWSPTAKRAVRRAGKASSGSRKKR